MPSIIKGKSKAYHYFLVGLMVPFLLCVFCIYNIFIYSSSFHIPDWFPLWLFLLITYLINLICFYLGFRAKNENFSISLGFALWLGSSYVALCLIVSFCLVALFFHIPTS